jgi:hypothetical protein
LDCLDLKEIEDYLEKMENLDLKDLLDCLVLLVIKDNQEISDHQEWWALLDCLDLLVKLGLKANVGKRASHRHQLDIWSKITKHLAIDSKQLVDQAFQDHLANQDLGGLPVSKAKVEKKEIRAKKEIQVLWVCPDQWVWKVNLEFHRVRWVCQVLMLLVHWVLTDFH